MVSKWEVILGDSERNLDVKIGKVLDAHALDYVVVGGHAVIRHLNNLGVPLEKTRPTIDADVVFAIDEYKDGIKLIESELKVEGIEFKKEENDKKSMTSFIESTGSKDVVVADALHNGPSTYKMALSHVIKISGINYPEIEALLAMKLFSYYHRKPKTKDEAEKKKADKDDFDELLKEAWEKFDKEKLLKYASEIQSSERDIFLNSLRGFIQSIEIAERKKE